MVKVGQVVMKIAGRDAGSLGAVVDILDNNFVLVDGLIRRRKCNLRHLEILNSELKIKKGASSEEIKKELIAQGFEVKDFKKGKRREHKEKPKQIRKSNTTEDTATKAESKTKGNKK